MIDGQLDLFQPPVASVDDPRTTDDLPDLAQPPPPPPTDEAGRLEQLLAMFPAGRPAACRCDRPILAADEHDETRCWLCGHPPRSAEV